MKVLLLSGAYKNAGDFLIVQRSREILQRAFPGCETILLERRFSLADQLDLVNTCDLAVLCGGPGYSPYFYPNQAPLLPDLSALKPKLMALGMGWQSRRTDPDRLYGCRFAPKMEQLLQRIQRDTHLLGCRDWYSVRVLRHNNLSGALMTGCPAWYHPDFLHQTDCRLQSLEQVKTIAVSDPANLAVYRQQVPQLLQYLRRRFPNVQLRMFFHRGIGPDSHTSPEQAGHLQELVGFLRQEGIPYEDLSYSCQGLASYDDCDLHIGYRVHAHIYNMSRRTPSFLLEEDCRGAGANDAMGLSPLRAFSPLANRLTERAYHALRKVRPGLLANAHLIQELNDQLYRQQATGFWQYQQAYDTMHRTYQVMEQQLQSVGDLL